MRDPVLSHRLRESPKPHALAHVDELGIEEAQKASVRQLTTATPTRFRAARHFITNQG
jgi:hypothetical protein